MNKEQLLEKLDNLNFKEHTTDYIYYYLCGVAEEVGARDFSGHFVSSDNVAYLIRNALDRYDVYKVVVMLRGIIDFSYSVYYKDDYGNLRNVNKNDLRCLWYDLKICIEEWM